MKIQIYVPTTNINVIDWLAREFTNIFGGCTLIPNCKGYWKNPETNEHEIDSITIIESYTNDENLEFESIIGAICATIKDKLKQQSIMYTLNNKAYFV